MGQVDCFYAEWIVNCLHTPRYDRNCIEWPNIARVNGTKAPAIHFIHEDPPSAQLLPYAWRGMRCRGGRKASAGG